FGQRPRGRRRVSGERQRGGRPVAGGHWAGPHRRRNLGRSGGGPELPPHRGRVRFRSVFINHRKHSFGKPEDRADHGALGPGGAAQAARPAAGWNLTRKISVVGAKYMTSLSLFGTTN